MLRDVWLKTLYDGRRGLLAWTVSLLLLVGMYAAIWPSLKGQPSMSDFLDNMPETFRALFAVSGADMSTPVGYVQIELLSFMGPLLLILYAVVAGSSAVAGEEDRHTLDLLLANPVSRPRLVLEKAAAMVLGTVGLAAVLGGGLVVVGRWAGMALPVGPVAAAMLHMALLGLVFGALALAIGATTGNLGAARAVPALLAVVTYVINGLGPQVSWLEPLQKLSPFYQYIGHDPLRNGISVAGIGVALAEIAVLVAVAVVGFRRRDVAA
jgi:ABC-2 type transport system permease protein